MATLKNSRGKFFEIHRMPPDRIFWHHFLDWAGRLSEVPVASIAGLSSWRAERSNCPELTLIMEDLIRNVPIEWRATVRNIFVGRVIDASVNAKAWTMVKAGIIEINVQYTFVLSAYVAAFDEYMVLMKDLLQGLVDGTENIEEVSADLDSRLSKSRSHLEEYRPYWLDSRLLAPSSRPTRHLTSLERLDLRENAESACEEFIIAHELAHHLLCHTTSRPSKSKATTALQVAVKNAGLSSLMTGLNQRQIDELHADILGFLIVANAVDRIPSFSKLYRAIFGSVVSLIAVADIYESWIEPDRDATHPGFVTRCAVIAKLTDWFSQGRVRGPSGDHPLGAMAQLHSFGAIAVNAWRHRMAPDEVKRVGITNFADHLLKLAVEANERIPKDNRFGIVI